jgi:hypothetical protein
MTASTPLSAAWGALVTGGFAAGAIPYIASDNTPTADIANLFWDSTNKRLHIGVAGDTTGTDPINSYSQHDQYQIQSNVPASNPWASTLAAQFTVSSSRGTVAVNAVLQTGDFVGGFFGWGYIPLTVNTPTYTPIAGTWAVVRGVDANGNLGGELHFGAKADSGVFTDLGFIDSAGVFRPTVSEGMQLGKTAFGFAAMFLGYSNSGAVGNQTISKSSGRSGIAAAGTSVTITNTKVTATSIVLVQLETADATMKSLTVAVGSGNFIVTGNAAATAQVAFSFVVLGN